jgi:hypothetical protein
MRVHRRVTGARHSIYFPEVSDETNVIVCALAFVVVA